MDNYSNEEIYPDNSYNEDASFRNSSLMEVTDGLFSRCQTKSEKREDVKKEGGQVTTKSSRMNSHQCDSKPKKRINGYIYFYMELYAKNAGKHVTCVAKIAGKRWNCLSAKEKERYKQLANARNQTENNSGSNGAAVRYPKVKTEVKREK